MRGAPVSGMYAVMSGVTACALVVVDQILAFHVSTGMRLAIDAALAAWGCVLLILFLRVRATGNGALDLRHMGVLIFWLGSVAGLTGLSIATMWEAHGALSRHARGTDLQDGGPMAPQAPEAAPR